MTNRENMELIFNHKPCSFIPHLGSNTYGVRDYMVERPIRTTGLDAWGCNWISCPDSLGITHPDTSDIKMDDVSQWREKVQFPDLDNIDFSSVYEDAAAVTDRDSQMVVYTSLNGIFERTHVLMRFDVALCQTMLNPVEYGKLLEAIADHKIKLLTKIYEIAQPDVFIYHDDMATQAGPFFPTSFYETYLFPQYKRIVDAAKAVGYKYVVQHSCGKIESLLPQWINCGFDGWHSVMPCNDLAKIKKEYGDRLVFLSGMDTQGVLGKAEATRHDIEHMVVEWMELLASDGTGFIPSNAPSLSLNPANEKICVEFLQKHGEAYARARAAGMAYIPEYE